MKLDVTPVKPNLPKIYNSVKRFVSKLGLEYKMVDYCNKRPCSYIKINSVQKMARWGSVNCSIHQGIATINKN